MQDNVLETSEQITSDAVYANQCVYWNNLGHRGLVSVFPGSCSESSARAAFKQHECTRNCSLTIHDEDLALNLQRSKATTEEARRAEVKATIEDESASFSKRASHKTFSVVLLEAHPLS